MLYSITVFTTDRGAAKNLRGRVQNIFKDKDAIPHPKIEKRYIFYAKTLLFRLAKGHLKDNSLSGRVQCTRCEKFLGATAPTAPMLSPFLTDLLGADSKQCGCGY